MNGVITAKQQHALKNVCRSTEELKTILNNPDFIKVNTKHQACVTLLVAEDGPEKELVWSACVRLANPKKRNFRSVTLWTVLERLRAHTILLDQVKSVGEPGEEFFRSIKGLHLIRKLTKEEKVYSLED